MSWKFIIHHLSFIIRKSRGFTLVELLIVMSIMALLLGFITINLVSSQQTASLTAIEEVLIADLRQQQLKSMIGDTEGRASSDSYGIRFESDRYILFHGTEFVEGSSNTTNNLPNNIQFNNAEFDVIFSRLSGESGAPTIIEMQDSTNSNLKRIHVNSIGVVTQVESL